jgi:Mg-chelatase subunit ChlD
MAELLLVLSCIGAVLAGFFGWESRMRPTLDPKTAGGVVFWGLLIVGVLAGSRSANAQVLSQSENVAIVLVVDNSVSMEKSDPKKSRLSLARLIVDASTDGDQIGIVKMADLGNTQIAVELTDINRLFDKTAFSSPNPSAKTQFKGLGRAPLRNALEEMRTLKSDGRYLGRALKLSADLLERAKANHRQFIVLLTDGPQKKEGQNVLDDALTNLRRKNIPIIAVAVGAQADVATLKELSESTGGRLLRADGTESIAGIYAKFFACVRAANYVERVQITPTSAQTLATINPPDKAHGLAILLSKSNYLPKVKMLAGSSNQNIVDPSADVQHSDNSAYEVFVLDGKSTQLAGEWRIQIDGNSPAEAWILVQSYLTVDLISPPRQPGKDQASLRYTPAGKPVLIELQIPSSEVTPELMNKAMKGPLNEPQTGLSPAVDVTGTGAYVTLSDDGEKWDHTQNDGIYTTYSTAPLSARTYTATIEIPVAKTANPHLRQQRSIVALPLPTLQMTVSSPSGSAAVSTLLIALTLENKASVTGNLKSLEAKVIIEEPDRNRYVASPIQQGSNTWTVSVPLRLSGDYKFYAKGVVTWNDGSKDLVYADTAQATYQSKSERAITAALVSPSNLGTMRDWSRQQITITLQSASSNEETVSFHLEGLQNGNVLSASPMRVPPRVLITKVIEISAAKDQLPGEKRFSILLKSDPGVTIKGSKFDFTYRVEEPPGAPWLLVAGVGMLIFVITGVGLGTILLRRKRRQD